MEMLMRTRKKNNSAICRVFGAGKDCVGNVWVVMERMAGDLRTLIDRRMTFLEDGQMPFDYDNTITMMMHIAKGMEDLHRCDLIHADLKASNILVTPVVISPSEEKFDGSQRASESMYFYVNIGDFETSNGVVGTGFWRAPEVLQALRNDTTPILSPAADVYSYGMLCYELLTGQIPFKKCALSDYNVILSGQRPQLPANVSRTMKELLLACWHMEPQERPGWTSIIKTLKEELLLHPPGSQQPKRRVRPRIGMARETIEAAAATSGTSNVVVTSWDDVVAQGRGTEAFATWKDKIVPEILLIVKVISEWRKALRQDTTMIWRKVLRQDRTRMVDGIRTGDNTIMRDGVLCAVDEAWDMVGVAWANLGGYGYHPGELTDLTYEYEDEKWAWRRRVWERYEGRTVKNWLKEILSTSEKWQLFQTAASAWHSENEGSFRKWKEEVQAALFAWEKVCAAIHAWHLQFPISGEAWQAVQNNKWKEDENCEVFLHIVLAKTYLEKNTKTDESMQLVMKWKALQLQKVTIRKLFLENILSSAGRNNWSFKKMCLLLER